MQNFELTSDEALQLISNGRRADDLENLFVKNRPHDCTFNGTIRGFEGKEIMFTCKGDELGSLYVIEVERRDNCYRLEYWGDSFKRIPPNNSSYSQNRLGIDDYTGRHEQALHDAWQEENKEDTWSTAKNGFLQFLLAQKKDFDDKYLTTRERRIVATIIQWLGTNCGSAFVEAAKNKVDSPTLEAKRKMGWARAGQL